MMASKGWKIVQAHVPLIKFRKGAIAQVPTATPSLTQPGTSSAGKISGATGPNVIPLPIIEDFQLPPRFRRRRIDEKEIEFINRGGPD